MRFVIDGYNVMHGNGRIGPNLGREGFRRARRHFLDELALVLGPFTAGETTVVFDATVPPGDFPPVSTYRRLTVLFALGDENADARIEQLIAIDSNPKTLTVVSSDNRIRLAASRRRARALTADEFWQVIDNLKEDRKRNAVRPPEKSPARPARQDARPLDEAEYWMRIFGDLDNAPEVREARARSTSMLTDAELEEIKRQIDREP
jgi:predicted RNA-binding protein with PIN domain